MATFSNTHLRIPDGFAELLMGLAKEVLRDQPEDIPTFAAEFFEALLKQREESGMNHAEWTAKQESSMIHTFKDSKPSPGAEPASDTRTSKGKSNESRSENETSNSAEASELPTTRANFSEEDHLTESTAEENHGENRNISTEKGIRDEESIKLSPIADVQSDKVSGTEDEGDSTIYKADKSDMAAQEKDTSSAIDTDVLSFSGVSNVDVCAQELGTAEDGGSDTQESDIVDEEMSESDVEGEEDSEAKESVVTPHSGLADVDICATELGGTERQTESATADRDTHTTEEESFKTLVQLPLAQFGTPEGNQQEAEDQTRKTKEEDETDTKASAEETHEGLPRNESALDFNATPKEESLVEISFEDVPEAQQITEVKEKQPEEKALQTELLEEVQQEEEAGLEEVTDMVRRGEPETEEVEKEFYSEREEIESQLRASDIMEENVVTNDTNLNDRAEDNRSISSSHQPSTEVDSKSPEEERDHTDEDDETREDRFSEDETKANDADFKEDETTGTVGEDNEDIDSDGETKDEDGDGGAETRSSQALVDLRSEDTQIEKDEEVAESDSEAREKRDEVCEDVTTADRRHVEEEAPPVLEKNKRTDEQEECSRPQEEEDIMDIPLDDPEANRAAAKIQAGFRGHMTRKKMKPEDKAEGEEVSSTGDVLNGSQGATATGGSGAVESDDTSVPEQ